MTRRELLQAVPAVGLAAQLHGESHPNYRLRAGLVAYSFRKQLEAKTMTYEALIQYVSELGLDGLDTTVYWFPDTSNEFLAKLRGTAYKNAINLYSVATRVRLSQPTPELQQAEVENAKKWVDVAEKLGAGHVRVFGGKVPPGATEEQCIPWAVEVLKRAADYAGTKGIFLGVEDDGGLTTNAEPTVEIIKRTGSPWAGINLDTGNFPKNSYAQIEMCLPYATSTHIKGHVSGPDGTKEKADWDRIAGMFAKSGYKGYLSLEYEEKDPEIAVPKLVAELKKTVRKYS